MKNKKLPIRPFYTVPNIAKIMGYTSAGARKFLFRMNLPIHLIGKRYVVFLTDLQLYCPEFYSSILESNNLNDIIDKNSELYDMKETDEVTNCKASFYSYQQG